LAVGTKVEANYAGKGTYYGGRVKAVNGEGNPATATYDILYDDGDSERGVVQTRVRLAGAGGGGGSGGGGGGGRGLLEEGTKVEANFGGTGNWFPGKISNINGEDDPATATYDILYDDGDRERGVAQSRVRLVGAAGGSGSSGGGGGGGLLEDGTKVEANFGGTGNWFPGKISNINGEDDPATATYDILYDDGDRERGVTQSRVRVVGGGGSGGGSSGGGSSGGALLEEGTKVEADFGGIGNYYPGKIKAVNGASDPATATYDILYDDGDSERGVPRSRIKLR
jgi:hypothetical protein